MTDLYIELFAHDAAIPGVGGGVTDHTALTSIGLNTHAQIDSFIVAQNLKTHPYDAVARVDGAIKTNEILFYFMAFRVFTVKQGSSFLIKLDAAPTSNMTFDLALNGTVVSTGSIIAGALIGTLDLAADIAIPIAQTLTIKQTDASDDATASGILIAMRGEV